MISTTRREYYRSFFYKAHYKGSTRVIGKLLMFNGISGATAPKTTWERTQNNVAAHLKQRLDFCK